jgi:hypothetical protein
VAGAAPGAVIVGPLKTSQPGNFGWLTWTGKGNAGTLAHSLTPPGDSATYVNPYNRADRVVSVRDWVQGDTGLSNSSAVRAALDALKALDITVPVWDVAQGTGANAVFRVAGFARVRVIGYRVPDNNSISMRYLGPATCGG